MCCKPDLSGLGPLGCVSSMALWTTPLIMHNCLSERDEVSLCKQNLAVTLVQFFHTLKTWLLHLWFMVKGPFPTVHLHRWYKMHGMMHWKGRTIYTGRDVQPFNTVTWCRHMKHFGHSLSGMLAVSELHIACAWSVVYTEIETPSSPHRPCIHCWGCIVLTEICRNQKEFSLYP